MNTKICRPIPTCFKPDDPCLVKMVGNGRVINSNFAQWSFPASGLVVSGRASMPSYARNSNATRGIGVGQIETVAANVLRMDYDVSTGAYLGALFEGQKANVLSHPADLSGASWVRQNSPEVTPAISCISGQIATKAVNTSGATGVGLYQLLPATSAGPKCFTVTIESIPGTANSTFATTRSATIINRIFIIWSNLTLGGQTSSIYGSRLTNLGIGPNGGKLCEVSFMTDTDFLATDRFNIFPGAETTPPAGSGAIIHHVQIEQGGMSSKIISGASSGVRQADTMVVNDVASWFNPEGGIFFAKVRAYPGQVVTGSATSVISLAGSGPSNSIQLVSWSGANGSPRGGVGNVYSPAGAILSEVEWEYLALSYSVSGGFYFARKTGAGAPIVTYNSNVFSGAVQPNMFIGGVGASVSQHVSVIRYQYDLVTSGPQIADLLNQYAAANS